MSHIALQIGHYPVEGGAAHEVITLQMIVPQIQKRLQAAGYTVDMYDGSLVKHGKNSHSAEIAIFCHCDAGSPSARGFSIGYWEEKHPGSQALAARVKALYQSRTKLSFRGYNVSDNEHYYYGNTRFTKGTKCIIMEFGFVSNKTEREYLQGHPKQVAWAVADAVIGFLGGKVTAISTIGEDNDMVIIPKKSKACFPAGYKSKTYFDITGQDKDTRVQLWFARDNGDQPSQDKLAGWQRDIKAGVTSCRFEAGELFGTGKDPITVWVEVIGSGSVGVTRSVE